MSQLDSQLWVRLQEQFHKLVDATQAERDAAIAELSASDPQLARELRALLLADAKVEQLDTLTRRMNGAVQQLASELDAEPARPEWIGDYRIAGTLGSGGMGVVYLAEQESPRRTVALKVIRAFGGANAVRRFHREAQLHGRLQHPGIALVHEAGLAAERDASGAEFGPPRPYFAMEYVQGEPVNAYVKSHHLETAQRVEIMAKICNAIEHAHSRHVIHRDLKSANVLIDSAGNPKVLDFGIARAVDRDAVTTMHTAVGEVVGTLPYMSPEQVSGSAEAATPQSDIYALGVVFFEMLTGRRPLDLTGRSLPEAVRIVTNDEPTRLGTIDRALRGDLETIVSRCLEKEPSRRYATAGALAADLRRYMEHRPIEARPASTIYQIAKFTRRHRPLVIGTATAFAALLAATTISIIMAVKAENARADFEKQLRRANIANTRSTQSFDFLANMFTSAEPHLNADREVTAHELLVTAMDRFDEPSFEENQVSGQLARLVGYTLFRLGDMDRAELALRRSAHILRKPDPDAIDAEERLVDVLITLGDLLRARGKNAEAETVLLEAIGMREKTRTAQALQRNPGPPGRVVGDDELEEPQLGLALYYLSLLHHAAGDEVRAEQVGLRAYSMQKAMAAKQQIPTTSVATVLASLAVTHMQLGRLTDAMNELREAEAIHSVASGPEAMATLAVRTSLGLVLRELGNYEESISLLQKTAESRQHTLPAGHHDTALCQLQLAASLCAAGQSLRALEFARPAAADVERVYGPLNPNTGRAKAVLAACMDATGDFEGAQLAAEASQAALTAAFGAESGRLAYTLVVLSSVARHKGELRKSAQLADQSLRLVLRTSPPSHRSALAARRERALVEIDAHRPQVAVKVLTQLLIDTRTELGDAHPLTGWTALILAVAAHATGDKAATVAAAHDAAMLLGNSPNPAPWMVRYVKLMERADGDAAFAASDECTTEAAAIEKLIADSAGITAPEFSAARRLCAGK